ncbi:hypothetical protein KCX82_03500 [Clostridiales bacterium BAD-6]|uniref:Uncharacterized protein n=1 Tax=Sinanaerobacter chloroacetimidivorans TaxID=2818044 RepID=A0A8J8B084_9FIRM|nr:hypothetical protein [Sinanaerobacter chloroacetimidivorans]
MNDPLLLIPLVLWLFTYGVTSFFHQIVKKKLGVHSESYENLRLPNFISNLLNSIVSVCLLLYIMNRSVPPEYTTYLTVPYFGITAYYITSAFRALKDARNN